MEYTRGTMEKKMLDDFFKELNTLENMTWTEFVEEKKIELKNTRRVKDWKRTLAGKFYEERDNASGVNGEGMDLLWEKYEMEAIKNSAKRDINTKKKMKKKEVVKRYLKEANDEEINEQLCCVKALKFSRKMNLGMGRTNLVRISKAIKEFRWLYHVCKNNKKVHCGDRF